MGTLPILSQTSPLTAGARGRLARYSLRVSVLEHCTLSCSYCKPGSVTAPSEKARWLSPSSYLRLARLFRSRGVVKVHVTGGEPLVRPDVTSIVAAFKEAMPNADLALTTNGLRLGPLVGELVRAGLRRATVHLDTLRADRYPALMGDGSPGAVLSAVEHARGALAIKMNVVVQKGRNDDELEDFLALSRRLAIEVRFIELMNTGSADEYTRAAFVAGRDIVASLGAVPMRRRHASDPASLYLSRDGVVFGVIASDTEPFCGDCDRLRLTADGRLRGCLYQDGGIPLGAALASGASDETLAALLDTGLDDKRSWHPLIAKHRVPFSMADVGG
jgi:cyclic pyranopterin phosphate synthase